jgi:GNAT superfamily N-acetyltransferase
MQTVPELPPSIRLSEAGAADAPRLSALSRAAYAKWLPLLGRPPIPYTADYEALLADHETWIAVEADGRDVAALVLRAAADHLLIWSVAVLPAQQGKGLGRALMAFAEGRALARRLPEIRLYTNLLMEANRRLYARLGYAETAREDRGDRVIVHMAKRVPSSA